MKSFYIDNIKIQNQVVLAPMAGVTNIAFRTVIRKFGVGLIYNEMVSDFAVNYKNPKTLKMLAVSEGEKPLSMQIFGSNVEEFVRAAKYIDQNVDCDIIDINMGCPVPKITKNEAGAKLLEDPVKVYELVSAVVNAVSKPVTVKMRLGFKENVLLQNIPIIEKAGAKAIAIHARLASQLYSGNADWEWIKKAKEIATVPIIGNSDIKTPEDAKKMLEYTKCDAVMIGRACLYNPWIMYRTVKYLNENILVDDISISEKFEIAFDHFDKLIETYGESAASKMMRKHFGWYLKNVKNAKDTREDLLKINTKEEAISIINNYKEGI